ncbi:MAG: response regulator [Candidatus Omnitrophica bacterium]|nr:response regulator [Candidatus Omnitrophota bacterium]
MKAKKKILIIDDEERFGQMLKVNLEMADSYEVFVETLGTRGLETAHRVRPDLILLDVIMPDLSGPDVARRIANDPVLKRTPVVFLTAMPEEKVHLEDFDTTQYPFLQKPVSSAEVIDFIEKRLSEQKR